MPGFPGAKISSGFCGDWDNFRPMACSRPPLPRTRTFMRSIQQPPDAQNVVEGHEEKQHHEETDADAVDDALRAQTKRFASHRFDEQEENQPSVGDGERKK